MELNEIFKKAVEVTQSYHIPYAIAGGLVASVYREEYRNTNDVDIVINPADNGLQVATDILSALGLEVGVARKADLQGGPLVAIKRQTTEPCMVIGRFKDQPKGPGVDILLPAIPWVAEGVRRAQSNLLDFGFGPIPAITVEDIIMAKFVALANASARDKDVDDLKSIFKATKDIDLKYLIGQMTKLEVSVPAAISATVPDLLLRVSNDLKKQGKQGKKR